VNENISALLGVVVIVGAVSPGHLTFPGHTTALPPEGSCLNTKRKDLPVVAVGNVKVTVGTEIVRV
jgi:hypothetical protein